MLWQPSQAQVEASLIHAFMNHISAQRATPVTSYDELYQWSINCREEFWSSLWDFTGIIGTKGDQTLLCPDLMEESQWFPEAHLNFAENLLKNLADPAIISKIEDFDRAEMSATDLQAEVATLAAWLRKQGIVKGDRVAGYLPNIPQTMIAMLATASIGAVWTSTSPDFGVDSVVERFSQTCPRILITVEGYFYNGKSFNILDKVEQIVTKLPALERVVLVELIGETPLPSSYCSYADITSTSPPPALYFEPCSFNDPLYILYSSGTTGKPKCITHSIGGTLLQHLKEHQLHCDIKPGDRVFYFTTCGWMMWNWLASVLASGATAVLYDGSPFYPQESSLWEYAETARVSLFGTSAKYLDMLKKSDFNPKDSYRLESLRTLCSTGSVLSPESFDFVYEAIKQDLCLCSISGGTDIISCFVLGSPILPVYRGACQCRGLGMDVAVFNEDGEEVIGQKGELVCRQSFPSQPINFWGDTDGTKYHQAYFAKYPNIWCHGDFVELTEQGSVVIYGRSDATLNPSGVRIGTAEIYRYTEQLPEVLESIVIGQEWDHDTRLVLFVVLKDGLTLDDSLRNKISKNIRANCTVRHVPAIILQVDEIPRTKSGKIVELAVREVVHDREVKNLSALANPETLQFFRKRVELTPAVPKASSKS